MAGERSGASLQRMARSDVRTDFYEVLGVPRDADDKTIQRAYRKQARASHPDINKEPGAEDRFKLVNLANEVLSDPQRRAKYDRLFDVLGDDWDKVPDDFDPDEYRRAEAASAAGAGVGPDFGAQYFTDDAVDIEDLLAGMFGRRPPRGPVRGPDQEAELVIDLDEAYEGASRKVSLGSRSFTAKIPAGVLDGQTIRLAGKGGSGINGGEPGDLYVHVRIAPDPTFSLHGRDVTVRLEVAPWEAALGATVPVRTPTGDAKVQMPAGTSSGKRLRLRGRGLPNPKGDPGDLFAEVSITVPVELDDAQRAAFEELAGAFSGYDPRAAATGSRGGGDG